MMIESHIDTEGAVTAVTVSVRVRTPPQINDWQEIRRDGKLLFEYHPVQHLVRIVRGGRRYVVELVPP